MTLLGIISDTHGRLHPGVWDAFAHVDRIVHAGDIGDPLILDELGGMAPVTACLGNNDHRDYGPSVGAYATARIDGVRLFVTHFPWEAEARVRDGEYRLVIHGHTHEPRDEVRGGVRILNPGSATRPRGGSAKSVMLVELAGGAVGEARLVELD